MAATTVSAWEWLRRGHFETVILRWIMIAAVAFTAGCKSPGSSPEELAAFSAQPQVLKASKISIGLTRTMESLDDIRPLAVGDTVSFQIAEEKDAPAKLEVASDGEIQIPMIGRVTAAGHTPRAVAYAVRDELEKTLYKKATVLIALDSETKKPEGTFYVTGQVRTQGPQEIARGEEITVAQAILRAGGFADFADKRRVTVIRRGPDGKSTEATIDVKAVLEEGRLEKDILVRPNDYVLVHERMFNF